ncbi:MAG: DUF2252 family protein, partial [Pseudobdellovibrionaceae bacterium]|nr:DUF2252 family protein [Pseudobdellovibrionaceae bacterium]
MHHYQLTQFIAVLALLIGCTSRSQVDDSLQSSSKRLKLPELSQEPLAPAVALTADYFRKSYPHLSAEQFQQKWIHSQKSGLLFMRSYVNTGYDELARVSSTGPIGPCLGDPHPENFGYLLFAGTFEYTANDVDDSGACPVIFDALRYFTTLKFVIKDNALEAELRRAYVGFLNGEVMADRPSHSLRPDAAALVNKLLKQSTKKGKIKLEGPIVALAASQGQTLLSILQANGCPTCKFLDAAQLRVNSGGSAGLERYLLLVEAPDSAPQLLEFKQLTDPAAQRGPWAQQQKLSRKDILEDIWGKNWPDYFAFVTWEGKSFL